MLEAVVRQGLSVISNERPRKIFDRAECEDSGTESVSRNSEEACTLTAIDQSDSIATYLQWPQ